MINFWDLNAKALIALSLVLISALLTYIAFFKDEKRLSKKSSR